MKDATCILAFCCIKISILTIQLALQSYGEYGYSVAICSTRTSTQHNVVVLRVRTMMGQKSFCYQGPSFWNNLPVSVKAINAFNRFKVENGSHFVWGSSNLTDAMTSKDKYY